MTKRVMELLGTLIVDEVRRKTCVSLSPEMREFLGWMLEVDREEEPSEQVCAISPNNFLFYFYFIYFIREKNLLVQ